MMPEPDFDQIARQIVFKVQRAVDGAGTHPEPQIAEQLRLVWNARGAADLVKLEADLASMMGVTASGPYVKNLDRALRSLDR